MRFLASCLLLLLVGIAGAATVTTVDCRSGGDPFTNKVTQAPVVSTQNTLTVQVTPGHPVTILLYCDQDWKFRTTDSTSTTDAPIAANQALTIRVAETRTFYTIRSSADGTLKVIPLKVE